jgi:16S rRNA (uracil1498-N3)-methyltransferase
MYLFYTNDIRGEYAFFNEDETRHCLSVLRKKSGDPLQWVDGNGGWYEGVIAETGKRSFSARIKSVKISPPKGFSLHIAMAPPKNIERFEWFLEKATEIGIHEITPIECEHSERTRIRLDRLEKIVVSAMKQTLRSQMPKLHELTSCQAFIRALAEVPGEKFIPNCHTHNLPPLKSNCNPSTDVTVLIGPEGDFSLQEIELAKQCGFREAGLGDTRLRTETAGIVACVIVNLINEKA